MTIAELNKKLEAITWFIFLTVAATFLGMIGAFMGGGTILIIKALLEKAFGG